MTRVTACGKTNEAGTLVIPPEKNAGFLGNALSFLHTHSTPRPVADPYQPEKTRVVGVLLRLGLAGDAEHARCRGNADGALGETPRRCLRA